MKIFFLIIFLVLLLHYFLFLLKIFKGLGKVTRPLLNGIAGQFISVIIPFRNESDNIIRSLESIQKLNYPEEKFEVIYVDDNSTDNSFNLAESNRKKINIKLIRLPYETAGRGNKKQALQYGIARAKGDIIVTTDADCIHHENWLRNLTGCFDKETAFVSGPVDFAEKPGIFSEIQVMEFEGLILAGAGLIGEGRPTICNGANIAYRKSVFEEVKGLNDSLSISSGDDELLMQKISRETSYKVRFCAAREAVVMTDPNTNLKNFFNQRKRWASKTFIYKDQALISKLILIFLFYLGLVLQVFLVSLGYYIFLSTLVFSLVIKISSEFLIIKKGEHLFFSRRKILIFIITEFLQVPYIIITATAGLFGRFNWKDRIIKR